MMCLFFFCRLISFNACHTKLAVERMLTQNLIALHEERLFYSQNNFLGEKWLSCIGCGTDRITTSALGTGIAIKQLFPGELLDFGDAVILALFEILQQR